MAEARLGLFELVGPKRVSNQIVDELFAAVEILVAVYFSCAECASFRGRTQKVRKELQLSLFNSKTTLV